MPFFFYIIIPVAAAFAILNIIYGPRRAWQIWQRFGHMLQVHPDSRQIGGRLGAPLKRDAAGYRETLLKCHEHVGQVASVDRHVDTAPEPDRSRHRPEGTSAAAAERAWSR